MSGSFRDSFTRDDTKEDLLGYDDTAFYYFAISVLTCVAVPFSWSVVRDIAFPSKTQIEKDFPQKSSEGSIFRYCQVSTMVDKVENRRRDARKCTPRVVFLWVLKVSTLTLIWACIFGTAQQLGDEKEIKNFDPFDILGVETWASALEIKKNYRKLSLLYHPDKNPDDPLAASRFIQITKAYQALTDDAAKQNFEKYGNVDGPQTTRVGLGLPRFLLEKKNSVMILSVFFFLILFVAPATFLCYFQKTKNYVANGVMLDTLQFLGYYVSQTVRAKNGPELLAACSESRNMGTRPSDKAEIERLQEHVTEHRKRTFTLPVVIKNQCLIWAHLQRKHDLMTPELRVDCDALLRHSMKITQAMIEIACMREWFATAQAMIDFRRCLVQAMDIKSSQLLQVPFFTKETMEAITNSKATIPTLAEFIQLDADKRTELTGKMESQQLLDVGMFCTHVSDVELKASIAVEDEPDIVVGDVATVTVQMLRKNLREDEAMGPVHAPFFPEPKFEEWWIFLVEAAPSTRIVHFERVCDQERCVEEKLRFQVTRAGKNHMVLHALCDAYIGIDKKVELDFHAFTEEEIKREYKIHEMDDLLDLQPTLFQQWMGDLRTEEESEEEEEEEFGTLRPRTAAKPAAKPAAKSAAVAKGAAKRKQESAEEIARRKEYWMPADRAALYPSSVTQPEKAEQPSAQEPSDRESSDSSSGSE